MACTKPLWDQYGVGGGSREIQHVKKSRWEQGCIWAAKMLQMVAACGLTQTLAELASPLS